MMQEQKTAQCLHKHFSKAQILCFTVYECLLSSLKKYVYCEKGDDCFDLLFIHYYDPGKHFICIFISNRIYVLNKQR